VEEENIISGKNQWTQRERDLDKERELFEEKMVIFRKREN